MRRGGLSLVPPPRAGRTADPPPDLNPIQSLLNEIVHVKAGWTDVAVTLRTGLVVRLTGSLAAEFLKVLHAPGSDLGNGTERRCVPEI